MDKETPPITEDKTKASTKKKITKQNMVTIVLIILSILTIISGVTLYFLNYEDNATADNEETSSTPGPETNPPVIVYKVEKWNNDATYKPTIAIYNEDYELAFTYHNVATLTNGLTVIRTIMQVGPTGPTPGDVFLVDENNAITILEKYSVSEKENYATDIKFDSAITLPEIFPEQDIAYKAETLVFKGRSVTAGDFQPEESLATKISSGEYGDLYEYKKDLKEDFYIRRYFIKTTDKDMLHYYELATIDIQDNESDDLTLKVNWTDEANKSLMFETPISIYHYGASRLHVKNLDAKNQEEIGKVTQTGKPIYKLTDEKTLKIFYDLYFNADLAGHELNFEDYKTKLTHVVYQDAFGEWIVLNNREYNRSKELSE